MQNAVVHRKIGNRSRKGKCYTFRPPPGLCSSGAVHQAGCLKDRSLHQRLIFLVSVCGYCGRCRIGTASYSSPRIIPCRHDAALYDLRRWRLQFVRACNDQHREDASLNKKHALFATDSHNLVVSMFSSGT